MRFEISGWGFVHRAQRTPHSAGYLDVLDGSSSEPMGRPSLLVADHYSDVVKVRIARIVKDCDPASKLHPAAACH